MNAQGLKSDEGLCLEANVCRIVSAIVENQPIRSIASRPAAGKSSIV